MSKIMISLILCLYSMVAFGAVVKANKASLATAPKAKIDSSVAKATEAVDSPYYYNYESYYYQEPVITVQMGVKQTIYGASHAEYLAQKATYDKVFINTIVLSFIDGGIPTATNKNIQDFEVLPVLEFEEEVGRRRLQDVNSVDLAYVVRTSDPTYSFDDWRTSLLTAITSGEFDNILRANAQADGLTPLLSGSTSLPEIVDLNDEDFIVDFNVTAEPTETPSAMPSKPTELPTEMPSMPTHQPTVMPTLVFGAPTPLPTAPVALPTRAPTVSPTPVALPTRAPTVSPTPVALPTRAPTVSPTVVPSAVPTVSLFDKASSDFSYGISFIIFNFTTPALNGVQVDAFKAAVRAELQLTDAELTVVSFNTRLHRTLELHAIEVALHIRVPYESIFFSYKDDYEALSELYDKYFGTQAKNLMLAFRKELTKRELNPEYTASIVSRKALAPTAAPVDANSGTKSSSSTDGVGDATISMLVISCAAFALALGGVMVLLYNRLKKQAEEEEPVKGGVDLTSSNSVDMALVYSGSKEFEFDAASARTRV